ncbi:hypothetical protein DB32_007642 [Sandaracinus amylolyticus]|uniref:Rhs-family protein n=1 Tax=Sandaracinus amylolyticus TaxID=927083 RepID=A0A0F6W8Z0_9BACT|nr:hypothetical protein DB32_007642 [Sandaracinus amylolyticus]
MHDSLGRLTDVTSFDGATIIESTRYDVLGNITSRTGSGATCTQIRAARRTQ